MSTAALKKREYESIWAAVPVGRENAAVARDIANDAGVNRRSCGTKLSGMSVGDYGRMGLKSYYDGVLRQNLWYR